MVIFERFSGTPRYAARPIAYCAHMFVWRTIYATQFSAASAPILRRTAAVRRKIVGFCIGVLVNPLSGLGGAVGLKGSDGADVVAKARTLGASANAVQRMADALRALRGVDCRLLTVAGAMGETSCLGAGLDAEVVFVAGSDADGWMSPAGGADTSAGDTRAACRALLAAGAQLILFGGGDGTARDIADVVADAVPLVGVPCGVKMYSGVFATSAARAGEVAAACASGRFATRRVELLDIDESMLRRDIPATRLYGYASAPVDRVRMQAGKASMRLDDDAEIDAGCRQFAASMEPDRLYVIGPGTTTARLCAHLGLCATTLGVDVIANGALVAADASERTLLALLDRWPKAAVVIGVIGRQGCLFGRGNQPISARVLKRMPREQIHVIASLGKLLSLVDGRLFVDTGDSEVDRRLEGPLRIRTGAGRSAVMRVTC
ncbi:ATP-NAD kinase family protein [Paraburkholderia caballeronis]|uniref:ATP-NAD kinase family protein n=1 Tax=Paraburkholderia caballeronis TaxID=416943 RepID=UPI001064EFF7|nr:NAD(+)/NADH kinase [Paraburkholderia caballeronis]